MKNFTATTKSGKTVEVNETSQVKQVATKDGMKYVLVITAADAPVMLGVTLPAGRPEALVVLDDQKGYHQYKEDMERAAYEKKLAAAAPKTLEEQRAALVSAEYNAYDETAFPGSRADRAYQDAYRALLAFDAAHPEVEASQEEERADEKREENRAEFVNGPVETTIDGVEVVYLRTVADGAIKIYTDAEGNEVRDPLLNL